MSATVDFLVVGGGVMGCSVAYHLASRRARVRVCERRQLASGGSGKSAAVIRCHYSNEITTRMALLSRKVWEDFGEQHSLETGSALEPGPGNVGWHKTGMVIVSSPGYQQTLEQNIRMQQAVGVRTEMITAAELRAIEPRAEFADHLAGAFEADAGYVDPIRATAAFATAARRHGAVIEEFNPIVGFEMEGPRVIAVRTQRETIAVGTVVLATGAWSARLGTSLGLELPIIPQRAQLGIFRQPADFGQSHAVFADFDTMSYYKPLVDGYTHIGTIDDREAHLVHDPDDYRETADAEIMHDLGNCLSHRFPDMKRAINRGGWAGLYDITPDWHPVLDRAPGLDNVYLCCGFSGHGFKLSPLVGRLMSELVLDGDFASMEATPLRYSRFQEGAHIGSSYVARVLG